MDRQFGLLTLQPFRQLLADGEPVHIGGKALDVLSVLVEADGKVVTKDELMETVWPNLTVEENVLHVHVSAIRKALGAEAGRLSAVWGRGYRFDTTDHGEISGSSDEASGGLLARQGRLLSFLLAAVLLGGAVFAWQWQQPENVKASELPADPKTATLYIDARDRWAERTPVSLAQAIDKLQAVIAREPGFAPAHAALADAYLLVYDYGDISMNVAFGKARLASQKALALDPKLADAHRALGFIQYWFEHDPAAAGQSFRRALKSKPNESQTHFWYANILADNGEFAAAEREFAAARLGDPGSTAIETEHGWALWMAGREAEGKAKLEAVLVRDPRSGSAWNNLVLITMVDGDLSEFLHTLQQRENSRNSHRLDGLIADLQRDLAAGDRAAFGRHLFDSGMRDQAAVPFPDHSWPALVASVFDNRGDLLTALRAAERNREKWGAAGYVNRIAAKWRGDREIAALLEHRRAGRVEPGA